MLNDALRLVRLFHGLNKTQIAEKVGLSKSYVTELEASDKKVTIDVLEKYAAAFNMPISSLMFFSERLDVSAPSDRVRVAVAQKVVKMLDWLAAVTEEPGERAVEEERA